MICKKCGGSGKVNGYGFFAEKITFDCPVCFGAGKIEN